MVYFTNVTSRSDEMKQKIGYLYGYVTTGSNFGAVAKFLLFMGKIFKRKL